MWGKDNWSPASLLLSCSIRGHDLLDIDFCASTANTVLDHKTGRCFNSLFLLTTVYIPESYVSQLFLFCAIDPGRIE